MIRSSSIRTLPICSLVLAVCILPAQTQETVRKEPVPEKEAQDRAERLIRTLFRADYLKRRPAELLALAGKLYQQALETNDDPAARFVLLRESQVISARYGDYGAAFKAIEEMDRLYTVNAPRLKANALEASLLSTSAIPDFPSLAREALAVIDQAVLQDDYETAYRLARIAATAARRARSVPLTTSAQARGKSVEAIKAEYERLKPDLELLQTKPDDPDANARVGRFLCLHKGDWEKGLPLLAKGNDPKLQPLAKNDLAAPTDSTAQSALGDSWYALAEGQEEVVKNNVQVRAHYWYRRAAAGDLVGDSRTTVETRLKELEGKITEAGLEVDTWLVLFRSADPSIWGKDMKADRNNYAIDLKTVPQDIKYVRLTNTKTGDYRIVPVTRAKLTSTGGDGRFGWNGTNKHEYNGYHLGIYDAQGDATKGGPTVCVLVPGAFKGWRGWGFGHKTKTPGTGYAWDNEEIPPTVFEIAVKSNALTETEKKKLLAK